MKSLQKDYKIGTIEMDGVKRSIMSTHGHLIHGHTYRLRAKVYGKTAFSHS
ncbi:hypothetical protein AGMMS49975_06430 [Clostridia bacterium]|nr:hypothetical protein AGMMS49975_06430 [Clostridia bacterium]